MTSIVKQRMFRFCSRANATTTLESNPPERKVPTGIYEALSLLFMFLGYLEALRFSAESANLVINSI